MGVHRLGIRALVAAAAVSLAALAGAGCDLLDDDKVAAALDDAVEEAREGEDASTIDLREVTDFEWDRVVFFGAYVGEAEFKERAGFTWADADEKLGAGGRNARFLVFTDGDRVAKVVSYQGLAEISCAIADWDGYQRSESVFRVVPLVDPGEASYVLVPAGRNEAEHAELAAECGIYL